MDRPHDRTKHRNLHGVIEYLKNTTKVIKQRVRGVGGGGLEANYATIAVLLLIEIGRIARLHALSVLYFYEEFNAAYKSSVMVN